MKVALVTKRNDIKKMHLNELNSIFSDYIDIIPYSLEIDYKYDNNGFILKEAEILLVTDPKIFTSIKHLLVEDIKIIHLESAFLKNKVESLSTYPNGTKAIVCFNSYNISKLATTVIYEMGLTNLDLSVYNPNNPVLEYDYDLAIVGENSAIVPEEIKTIVSLGRRKVNVKTLINLSIAANILNEELMEKIYKYSKELAINRKSVESLFLNASVLKTNFNNFLNTLDDGIIIFDKDLEILYANFNIKKIFNITDSIVGKKIDQIEDLESIHGYIGTDNIENIKLEIESNKKLMLTIKKFKKILEADSYILTVKDVTKIINLQKTLQVKLKEQGLNTKYDFVDIYGKSNEIKRAIKRAKIISKLDKTVLITGETGTGKELFAQSIHNNSSRNNQPFVGINCAAFPATLFESELFGYEPGTFTGAKKGGKEGLLYHANNGTLFLDEIGDMPIEIQSKLLRILEEKEFMKLGGSKLYKINIRIIAATNRNLKDLISQGLFRKDLYYRINTFVLSIPPLRNRKKDIEYLTDMFIEELSPKEITIDKNVLEFIKSYTWEGNIRELKNCIEYMVNISSGHVQIEDLPEYIIEESNYQPQSIIKSKDDILYHLNGYERDIVISMLQLIDCCDMGRRKLHSELINDFPDLTEYKVRSLINDVLVENDIIELGSGRSGMKLTDKGKKIKKQIN